MKSQKIEGENKKIILGMIIGAILGAVAMLLSMSRLDIVSIIIALAFGAVAGSLFGGLIVASLVENKDAFTSLRPCFQILGSGLIFVLVDFVFEWITKTNGGNLKTILFSSSTLWSLICGMAFGIIFLRRKK